MLKGTSHKVCNGKLVFLIATIQIISIVSGGRYNPFIYFNCVTRELFQCDPNYAICWSLYLSNTPCRKAQIETGFRQFDSNGDGLVDLNELMSAMVPKGFTQDQVHGLMRKYDEDGDGCLNYQEFAAFWDIPIM